ncbi:hypothetical protein CTI12_AA372430 [Artemisia annua]|uniref:Ulp1 protease family, C-terminal catalytic domain-containing protein n=1 Tax=Artemisia annua TaxID=35608 RepID=A0A2U1M8B0_ARTAN|nr:hypothetical protein CTI12_AA372430 [Artemisia annua]
MAFCEPQVIANGNEKEIMLDNGVQLEGENVDNDIVFFPVIQGPHFFVTSVFEDYLLHKNHPNYRAMSGAPRKVLQLGCKTTNNFVDCGVFTMRHMEIYKGDGDCCDLCCLSKEGKKQISELRELRIKYVAKILLSDFNLVKSEFEREAYGFRN